MVKAHRLIEPLRRVVGGPYFEGQLTAAQGLPSGCDLGQEQTPDALAAIRRDDGKIMDVDERAGLKRREPDEADGNPHRRVAVPGEKHQRGGMALQSRDERGTHLLR